MTTKDDRVEVVEPAIQKRQQRRADGTYSPPVYRVQYRDPHGRQRTKTFKQLGRARRFKAEVLVNKDRGEFIDPARLKQPYGPWATEWLRGIREPGDAHKANLESIMTNYILPTFGHVAFKNIDEALIQQWANDVAEAASPRGGTLSGWHLKRIRALFLRSLRAAVTRRLISSVVLEVAKDVIEFDSPTRKTERFLTHKEAEFFIAGTSNGVTHVEQAWRPFLYTAVWTGCCWEELAGALTKNLDLDDGWLHVSTVATRKTSGHYELKTYPKTDYRRRSIELPPHLIETLRFHRAAAPASEYAFPNRDGGLLHYGNFRKRVFVPAVERSGLEHFTLHDLRHTHCAWLIDLGWSEFKIVRRMGWKDGRMLHSTYGHLLNRRNREAMDGLERVWMDTRAAADVT